MMFNGLLKYINEIDEAWLRLKSLTNCEDYYLNELVEEAKAKNITILKLINEKIMEVYSPKKSIKEKIFRIFRRKNTRK